MEKTLVQLYEIQEPREAELLIDLGVDHIGSVILNGENRRDPSIREVIRLTAGTASRSTLIPLLRDRDAVARVLEYYRPDFVHFCENLPLSAHNASPRHVGTEIIFNLQLFIRERFPGMGIIRSIPIVTPLSHPRPFPEHDLDRMPGPDGEEITEDGKKSPAIQRQTALRRAIGALVDVFAPISDFFMTDTVLGRADGADADDMQPVAGFVGITGAVCDWELAAWLVDRSPLPVILAGGLGPENVAAAIAGIRPAGADSCTRTNAVNPLGRPIRFRKDFDKVRRFIAAVREREDASRSGDDK